MGPGRILFSSAFEIASSVAGSECDAHAAGDQFRTASDGIQTNSNSGGSRYFSKALLCAAGWNLCVPGTSSGFIGDLWRDLLLRYAPDAGDRYPHGSGCIAI